MPSLIDIILSDQAAQAVCYTLVHSLWQGTLAALLAGAIILATRKHSAALRYNLLSALIAAFIIGVAITVIIQLDPSQPQTPINRPTLTTITVDHPTPQATPRSPTTPSTSILQLTNNYLNAHATGITLIWLACLGAQLLRLTGGLYNIHRLRRDSAAATPYWTTQLRILAQQLGIKRPVALLQSYSVKAPSAFGFLKPAILVPLGFLAQLPAHQVETILLHELAHIRRSDYLANILLHLTEAIFFFNPGIRWIAALIRREREACCDDMVLARTPDRHNYFEALVAFTQLTIDNKIIPQHAYMLQLGGPAKSDLFWRIRRMLEKENKKLHLLEKTVLSVALFALVSFSLIKPQPSTAAKTARLAIIAAKTARPDATATKTAVNASAPAVPSIAAPIPPAPATTPDTLPQKQFAFTSLSDNFSTTNDNVHIYKAKGQANDGHTYEIRKREEEIVVFKVDGERIPQEKYVQYLLVLAAFETQEHRGGVKIEEAAKPGSADQPQLTLDSLKIEFLSDDARGTLFRSATPPAEPAPPADPVATNAPDNTPRSDRAPTRAYPLVFSNNPNIDVLHIALYLVNAGVITDVNRYAFTLNDDFLVVNGTTQPYNIFKALKAKYIHSPGDTFEYSQYWTSKGNGSHCEVHTPTHSENLTNTY